MIAILVSLLVLYCVFHFRAQTRARWQYFGLVMCGSVACLIIFLRITEG